MAAKKLTPKQAEFVRQYLVDLNATQAAIRAGYSEKTANEQGSRLLANVSVSQAIVAAKDAGDGKRNASKIASELLDKTGVYEAIVPAQAKREASTF